MSHAKTQLKIDKQIILFWHGSSIPSNNGLQFQITFLLQIS